MSNINLYITTTKDNSGGIMATGGGILNVSNLTIFEKSGRKQRYHF